MTSKFNKVTSTSQFKCEIFMKVESFIHSHQHNRSIPISQAKRLLWFHKLGKLSISLQRIYSLDHHWHTSRGPPNWSNSSFIHSAFVGLGLSINLPRKNWIVPRVHSHTTALPYSINTVSQPIIQIIASM